MRRTPAAPSRWWMDSHTALIGRNGGSSRGRGASGCRAVSGQADVVFNAMQPRAPADVRGAVCRSWGQSGGHAGRSIGPVRADGSSPEARQVPPDFDTPIEVHRVFHRSGNSETVRAGAAERGLLLGKHHATRRLVVPGMRVSASALPAIEVRLGLVERLNRSPRSGVFCAWPTRLRPSLSDRNRRRGTPGLSITRLSKLLAPLH